MSVKIYVANNEQTPWIEEEIGFPTYPMETKAKSGFTQTGDYFAEVDGFILPVMIERKSLQDFYGSCIAVKNRKRLYNEIDRFHNDERFEHFLIVVEGREDAYMKYIPRAIYAKRTSVKGRRKFIEIVNGLKKTVLDELRVRGARVVFRENREQAVKVLSNIVNGYIEHSEQLRREGNDGNL